MMYKLLNPFKSNRNSKVIIDNDDDDELPIEKPPPRLKLVRRSKSTSVLRHHTKGKVIGPGSKQQQQQQQTQTPGDTYQFEDDSHTPPPLLLLNNSTQTSLSFADFLLTFNTNTSLINQTDTLREQQEKLRKEREDELLRMKNGGEHRNWITSNQTPQEHYQHQLLLMNATRRKSDVDNNTINNINNLNKRRLLNRYLMVETSSSLYPTPDDSPVQMRNGEGGGGIAPNVDTLGLRSSSSVYLSDLPNPPAKRNTSQQSSKYLSDLEAVKKSGNTAYFRRASANAAKWMSQIDPVLQEAQLKDQIVQRTVSDGSDFEGTKPLRIKKTLDPKTLAHPSSVSPKHSIKRRPPPDLVMPEDEQPNTIIQSPSVPTHSERDIANMPHPNITDDATNSERSTQDELLNTTYFRSKAVSDSTMRSFLEEKTDIESQGAVDSILNKYKDESPQNQNQDDFRFTTTNTTSAYDNIEEIPLEDMTPTTGTPTIVTTADQVTNNTPALSVQSMKLPIRLNLGRGHTPLDNLHLQSLQSSPLKPPSAIYSKESTASNSAASSMVAVKDGKLGHFAHTPLNLGSPSTSSSKSIQNQQDNKDIFAIDDSGDVTETNIGKEDLPLVDKANEQTPSDKKQLSLTELKLSDLKKHVTRGSNSLGIEGTLLNKDLLSTVRPVLYLEYSRSVSSSKEQTKRSSADFHPKIHPRGGLDFHPSRPVPPPPITGGSRVYSKDRARPLSMSAASTSNIKAVKNNETIDHDKADATLVKPVKIPQAPVQFPIPKPEISNTSIRGIAPELDIDKLFRTEQNKDNTLLLDEGSGVGKLRNNDTSDSFENDHSTSRLSAKSFLSVEKPILEAVDDEEGQPLTTVSTSSELSVGGHDDSASLNPRDQNNKAAQTASGSELLSRLPSIREILSGRGKGVESSPKSLRSSHKQDDDFVGVRGNKQAQTFSTLNEDEFTTPLQTLQFAESEMSKRAQQEDESKEIDEQELGRKSSSTIKVITSKARELMTGYNLHNTFKESSMNIEPERIEPTDAPKVTLANEPRDNQAVGVESSNVKSERRHKKRIVIPGAFEATDYETDDSLKQNSNTGDHEFITLTPREESQDLDDVVKSTEEISPIVNTTIADNTFYEDAIEDPGNISKVNNEISAISVLRDQRKSSAETGSKPSQNVRLFVPTGIKPSRLESTDCDNSVDKSQSTDKDDSFRFEESPPSPSFIKSFAGERTPLKDWQKPATPHETFYSDSDSDHVPPNNNKKVPLSPTYIKSKVAKRSTALPDTKAVPAIEVRGPKNNKDEAGKSKSTPNSNDNIKINTHKNLPLIPGQLLDAISEVLSLQQSNTRLSLEKESKDDNKEVNGTKTISNKSSVVSGAVGTVGAGTVGIGTTEDDYTPSYASMKTKQHTNPKPDGSLVSEVNRSSNSLTPKLRSILTFPSRSRSQSQSQSQNSQTIQLEVSNDESSTKKVARIKIHKVHPRKRYSDSFVHLKSWVGGERDHELTTTFISPSSTTKIPHRSASARNSLEYDTKEQEKEKIKLKRNSLNELTTPKLSKLNLREFSRKTTSREAAYNNDWKTTQGQGQDQTQFSLSLALTSKPKELLSKVVDVAKRVPSISKKSTTASKHHQASASVDDWNALERDLSKTATLVTGSLYDHLDIIREGQPQIPSRSDTCDTSSESTTLGIAHTIPMKGYSRPKNTNHWEGNPREEELYIGLSKKAKPDNKTSSLKSSADYTPKLVEIRANKYNKKPIIPSHGSSKNASVSTAAGDKLNHKWAHESFLSGEEDQHQHQEITAKSATGKPAKPSKTSSDPSVDDLLVTVINIRDKAKSRVIARSAVEKLKKHPSVLFLVKAIFIDATTGDILDDQRNAIEFNERMIPAA